MTAKTKNKVKAAGRPSEGRKMVSLRLTAQARANLDRLAEAWNCDKTKALEVALEQTSRREIKS